MAHFAQLDQNNVVVQVIVVDDKDTQTELGIESEEVGIAFCKQLFGEYTKWAQTSYSGSIRGAFAGVGSVYDSRTDVFLPPRPYLSWVFDNKAYKWNPPVAKPDDGKPYQWDEATTSWVEMIQDPA
jgi:hypothetical protein